MLLNHAGASLRVGWDLTTGDVSGSMTTDGRMALPDTQVPDGGNLAYEFVGDYYSTGHGRYVI